MHDDERNRIERRQLYLLVGQLIDAAGDAVKALGGPGEPPAITKLRVVSVEAVGVLLDAERRQEGEPILAETPFIKALLESRGEAVR